MLSHFKGVYRYFYSVCLAVRCWFLYSFIFLCELGAVGKFLRGTAFGSDCLYGSALLDSLWAGNEYRMVLKFEESACDPSLQEPALLIRFHYYVVGPYFRDIQRPSKEGEGKMISNMNVCSSFFMNIKPSLLSGQGYTYES